MAAMTRKLWVLLLVPVVLGLAYASVPSSDCQVKTRLGLSETVALDGYSLEVLVCGGDKPTVIIEPGLNVKKGAYYDLQRRIAPHAAVVTYDHAGIGESTLSGNPRTLPFYVQELKAMLAKEELEPPYILIGHSLGGHSIRYFTDLYPDEVVGLVFLDHPHEDWFRYVRANWTPEEQEEYFKWWTPEVTSPDQVNLIERLEYDHNNDLIRGTPIPADIPVLMFTGDNADHFRKDAEGRAADMQAWADMQRSLLDGVNNAEQIVDWETSHFPQRDKPKEVAQAINEFIDNIRSTM
jgi:pimeloyl-ACP methyl ester carboxylesterase